MCQLMQSIVLAAVPCGVTEVTIAMHHTEAKLTESQHQTRCYERLLQSAYNE